MAKYAEDSGTEYTTLREYRRTAGSFKNGSREATLSFYHHRWIAGAYEKGNRIPILSFKHPLLFEQELVGWSQDEDAWPTKRDFHTFLEWFDIEFHSMVLDLAEGELSVSFDEG